EYEDDYLMEEDELSVEIIEDGSSYQAAAQQTLKAPDEELCDLSTGSSEGKEQIQSDDDDDVDDDVDDAEEIKQTENYAIEEDIPAVVIPIVSTPSLSAKSFNPSNPSTQSSFKGFSQGKSTANYIEDDTDREVTEFVNEKNSKDDAKSNSDRKLNQTSISTKLIKIPEKHTVLKQTPPWSKIEREQLKNRNIILEGSIRKEFSTPKSKSVKHHKSPHQNTDDENNKIERFHDSDNRERPIAKPLMKSLESDSSSESDSSDDEKDKNEDSSSSGSDSDSSSSNSDDGSSSDSDSDSDVKTIDDSKSSFKEEIQITKLSETKRDATKLDKLEQKKDEEKMVKPSLEEFNEKSNKSSKDDIGKYVKNMVLESTNSIIQGESNIKPISPQAIKKKNEISILKTGVDIKDKKSKDEENKKKVNIEKIYNFNRDVDISFNKKVDHGVNIIKKANKVDKHNEVEKSNIDKTMQKKENDAMQIIIPEDVSLGKKVGLKDNLYNNKCSTDIIIPKKNPVKRVTEIIITTDNGKKTSFGHLGGSNKENNCDERSKTNIVIRRVGVEGQEETITNKDLRITAGDRDADETITTKVTKGNKMFKQSNKRNGSSKTEKQVYLNRKSPDDDDDDRPKVKLSGVDLVQQVAAAFAQQLSAIQASQLKQLSQNSSSKESSRWEVMDSEVTGMEVDVDVDTEMEDLPIPIQAEVVMSDGSDSDLDYQGYQAEEDDQCITSEYWEDTEKCDNQELVNYLRTFVNGGGEGEVVEYPPMNNEVPCDGRDLTQWQLEDVHLPPFTPNVAPPSWLRLTIPAEGYRCHSCGDT
ncbi:unnamed protein product, partial [Meganyctiphanes norvegica]